MAAAIANAVFHATGRRVRELPIAPELVMDAHDRAPGAAADLGARAEPAGGSRLGLRGLWLVVPIAVLLAVGAGGPESSLLVLGPLVTYALPLIAMVAFWWEDWPGTRLRASWSGWADTALIAVGAVVLTALGQAIAGGLDLRALFDAPAGTCRRSRPRCRWRARCSSSCSQLTLVGEGWPLRRLPALVGGPLALLLSWAIALALYFALVAVDRRPARRERALGPVAARTSAPRSSASARGRCCASCVWRGRPTCRLSLARRAAACAHALVLGGGAAHLPASPGSCSTRRTVTAAAGCFVAAGIVVGMLFEAGRAALAALLLAAALFAGLSALAGAFTFTRASREDWVAHAEPQRARGLDDPARRRRPPLAVRLISPGQGVVAATGPAGRRPKRTAVRRRTDPGIRLGVHAEVGYRRHPRVLVAQVDRASPGPSDRADARHARSPATITPPFGSRGRQTPT